MQVKKQQLELDMEQQTGSKLGKEYVKAVYCHPAYLTSMQSTSWEMPGWMKHKLKLRFGRLSFYFAYSFLCCAKTFKFNQVPLVDFCFYFHYSRRCVIEDLAWFLSMSVLLMFLSKSFMATHSNTLVWKIPWTEKPGRLQSMGSLRVRHHWATSLSLFTFMHWRRKWQPTPVFLPGESQGQGSLVGCRLWGHTESDTTKAT